MVRDIEVRDSQRIWVIFIEVHAGGDVEQALN